MGAVKSILILHGWAYDFAKWDVLVKQLTQHGHNVIVLKIPGLTEKIDKPWTIDNYVDWLDSIVTKGRGEVVLLGHSNGGRIALSYSLKHPDKVSKLVLIDSAGIYHNELPIRLKRFVFKGLSSIGKRFTKSQQIRKLLYKLTGETDYAETSGPTRETMQNLISVDLTSRLADIKTKTLIIWGENDKTTTLSDGALMHKMIAGSRFEIIKSARHSPQFTDPEMVSDLINQFL